MLDADVVIAGGGVAGLLIGSALAPEFSVILIEKAESIPRNKYWLTDTNAAGENPEFGSCIDRHYEQLDFVAYDGLTATVHGTYCLWDSEKLIACLAENLARRGTRVLTGHQLYSVAPERSRIRVRANTETICGRLLIDCMGFGSPLVQAKRVASIRGYYILHGREVGTRSGIRPVALDNVVVSNRPAFFELFPASQETAHAALIFPSRDYRPHRSIADEFSFILHKSHYSRWLDFSSPRQPTTYSGIVPVGRLHNSALDRILFFGEAGQANPASSATGLTRMLKVYKPLAKAIEGCLQQDRLNRKDLQNALPACMTKMNRIFQESLFESILEFTSDDFRRLIHELQIYPADVVNDLLFAEFDFATPRALRLAADALRRPRGILGRHVVKSLARFLWRCGF